MYFAYIDESGKPNYSDQENIYVLSALIVHESEWAIVNDKVKGLKQKIWKEIHGPTHLAVPNDFELHFKDIYGGKKEFHGLSLDKRLELMEEIIEEIGKLDVNIISVAIIKKELRKKIDLNEWALRFLTERLELFMERDSSREFEFVIMVYDSENTHYDEIRRSTVQSFLTDGTYYQCKFQKIIETPFFVKSEIRNCIQFTDAISYITRRYLKTIDEPMILEKPINRQMKEMFKKIAIKYHRSIAKGETIERVKHIGLKIFPDSGKWKNDGIFKIFEKEVG